MHERVTFNAPRGSLYTKDVAIVMDSEYVALNIRDLVRRAQEGDIESYEEIVRRFRASAFGQAFARLGDSQLAEDAVQDAFIETHMRLESLAIPEAFPSWFRKVLVTACNRITRRKSVTTIPLNEAETVAADTTNISSNLEKVERDRLVHAAMQSLPDGQRTATALYYIGGMTQRKVGDYLGISNAAVKKRLHDARRRMGGYVTDMAMTISDEATPDDTVSARVIADLVSRPQPLLIEGHPVRAIVDRIKAALPEFESIEASEIEEADVYPSISRAYASESADAYRLDDKTVLRTQTTWAALRAIKGRTPPVRLITAGRVFRHCEDEDGLQLRVFHQLDLACVARRVSTCDLKEIIERVLAAVPYAAEIRYRRSNYGWVDAGMAFDVRSGQDWVTLGGCGMLKPAMLSEAGYEAGEVSGYGLGLGIERLAQLELGLKNLRELWLPPYLQTA